MSGSSPTLELRAGALRRGARVVLRDVDLRFGGGERVALIGPNGSGKSTLLRALAGVEDAARAEVALKGRALADWERGALAREIALLTQRPELPFPFTALETVLLGRSPWLGRFGMPAAGDIALARELLRALDMEEAAARSMAELSGGEQQRVHLARALAQQASVTLLDEPTSAQDFRGIARMMDALPVRGEEGRLVVVALHDLNLAPLYFDRVVLLHEGAVRADGTPDEVLRESVLAPAYGNAVRRCALGEGPGFVLLPRAPER